MKSKQSEEFLAGITVGDLRRQLKIYDQDADLYIGGLTFYRLKRRGPNLVSMEFNEIVHRDTDGTLVADDLDRPKKKKSRSR